MATSSTTSPLKLLLTGLVPSSADIPQWATALYGTGPEIEAKVQADAQRLRSAGHDITLYYFDDQDPATGLKWLEETLKREKFQGIQVGSGLRLLPQHMVLFENVLDTCRRWAPGSVFLFNDGPGTSWDAVMRNEEKLRDVVVAV